MRGLVLALLIRLTILSDTGHPLVGADVTCESQMAQTDSAGQMMCELEAGQRRIVVYKPGYREFNAIVRIDANRSNITIRLRRS